MQHLNVMSIVGILVAGINLFRPGLGPPRELLVLKCGGAIWALSVVGAISKNL
jgi:hypothetical protein